MKITKFRVWNKEEEKIESWESLLRCNPIWFRNLIKGELEEDYEIMQFTGLLDKNGKEIYEGDIMISPSKILFEVGESKGCFCYKRFGDENYKSYLKEVNEDWEVIGNQFENKKLIKNENNKKNNR